jgi:tetratricopeptide (TPR) repeat protein
VVVHDAGTYDQRVFVAMEFVEGQTLAAWLAEASRTQREILTLFAAAARGLGAAHAAGLVHRDFKPQNVMVGAGGKVRVMDFGLARAITGAGAPEASAEESAPEASAPAVPADAALTMTGELLGTPLFMAPEQFAGQRTDARTDQFSFCVALYQALYGEHPFRAGALATLMADVAGGAVKPAPPRTAVPVWLRRVLLRGLSTDPAQRWPSMDALLDALERDPARARRRFVAGAVGVGVVAALAAGVWGMARHREPLCQAGARHLAGVWETGGGGPSHERVRAAFLSTGLDYAAETWGRVAAALDGYVARWLAAYRDACEATHVRGEQSADVLDLRMDCLNRGLGGVSALVDLLATADRDVVAGAVNATGALPDLDRCSDVAALRAVLPPPRDAATSRRVEELRRRAAELKALTDAEKTQEAVRRSRPLVAEARAVGYGPLLAEILGTTGLAQRSGGDAAAADRSFEEAIEVAIASRDDAAAADTISLLAGSISTDFGRDLEAGRLIGLGEAILARLGPGHDRTRSWLEVARGNVRANEGNVAEAQRAYRRAVALKEKALGPDHPDVALSLNNLSDELLAGGDARAALEPNSRAIAIVTQAFGPESGQLGRLLSNRGEVLNALGRSREALPLFDRSLQVWPRAIGADSELLAYPLTGKGEALLLLGRAREAIAPLERALALRVATHETRSPLGDTRFALARALWDSGGDQTRARALAAAARDDFAALPPNPASRARAEAWLAAHPARGIVARTRTQLR